QDDRCGSETPERGVADVDVAVVDLSAADDLELLLLGEGGAHVDEDRVIVDELLEPVHVLARHQLPDPSRQRENARARGLSHGWSLRTCAGAGGLPGRRGRGRAPAAGADCWCRGRRRGWWRGPSRALRTVGRDRGGLHPPRPPAPGSCAARVAWR